MDLTPQTPYGRQLPLLRGAKMVERASLVKGRWCDEVTAEG